MSQGSPCFWGPIPEAGGFPAGPQTGSSSRPAVGRLLVRLDLSCRVAPAHRIAVLDGRHSSEVAAGGDQRGASGNSQDERHGKAWLSWMLRMMLPGRSATGTSGVHLTQNNSAVSHCHRRRVPVSCSPSVCLLEQRSVNSSRGEKLPHPAGAGMGCYLPRAPLLVNLTHTLVERLAGFGPRWPRRPCSPKIPGCDLARTERFQKSGERGARNSVRGFVGAHPVLVLCCPGLVPGEERGAMPRALLAGRPGVSLAKVLSRRLARREMMMISPSSHVPLRVITHARRAGALPSPHGPSCAPGDPMPAPRASKLGSWSEARTAGRARDRCRPRKPSRSPADVSRSGYLDGGNEPTQHAHSGVPGHAV